VQENQIPNFSLVPSHSLEFLAVIIHPLKICGIPQYEAPSGNIFCFVFSFLSEVCKRRSEKRVLTRLLCAHTEQKLFKSLLSLILEMKFHSLISNGS
jgi:hypothetical protein